MFPHISNWITREDRILYSSKSEDTGWSRKFLIKRGLEKLTGVSQYQKFKRPYGGIKNELARLRNFFIAVLPSWQGLRIASGHFKILIRSREATLTSLCVDPMSIKSCLLCQHSWNPLNFNLIRITSFFQTFRAARNKESNRIF